jgi:hypothetical protein
VWKLERGANPDISFKQTYANTITSTYASAVVSVGVTGVGSSES